MRHSPAPSRQTLFFFFFHRSRYDTVSSLSFWTRPFQIAVLCADSLPHSCGHHDEEKKKKKDDDDDEDDGDIPLGRHFAGLHKADSELRTSAPLPSVFPSAFFPPCPPLSWSKEGRGRPKLRTEENEDVDSFLFLSCRYLMRYFVGLQASR